MILRCPESDYSQVKFLVCLYLCPRGVKTKCAAYEKNYDALVNQYIEDKYLERYGAPDYPTPRARIIAAKKAEKAAKKAEKAAIEAAKPKKRKRRTKKEMEADNAKKVQKDKKKKIPVPAEPIAVEVNVPKLKRKRRTKLEMEEARKHGEKPTKVHKP